MSGIPRSLFEGYVAFKYGKLRSERARYRELAARGQKPEVMLIGCCDSRAAPETIFDASPGELFVVRNVANLVPPYEPDGEYHSTSAALEFGVQALKVKHIVVMGHARCGGIAAALAKDSEPLSPGDFIGKWISLAETAKKNVFATEPRPENLTEALELQSIRQSIANLLTFPCISILHGKGRL
ncbi:MAG: carbonic anhydrase, partial [Rhodobiaceae bacterium]|nr:carbonic anhydrase [Rhodobiaceae bacterium]